MDERRGSTDHRHEATRYEIRLKGRLDSSWAGWLGGMSLTHTSDGTTVVAGRVADQAALHGLLQRLRDIGVTLISINESEVAVVTRPDASTGAEADSATTPRQTTRRPT
jgi:hypothetical protein